MLAYAKTKSVVKEGENNKHYNCLIHIFAIFFAFKVDSTHWLVSSVLYTTHMLAYAKTKSVVKEGENNKHYNCLIHIFAIFCV